MTKNNARGLVALQMKPLCLGIALALPVMGMAQSAPAQEPATLPAVKVQAQADDGTTEGTGSYKPGRTRTATPLNLTPRETPQAVTVVTQQQIIDKGLTTVTDVINNVTGLYLNQYEPTRAQITARGFDINALMFDGLPTTWDQAWSSGEILTSTAMYDRVEVVRGANGLTSGVGDPGAAINLVRKRATSQELTGKAEVEVGNWDRQRVLADVSTPLNAAKTLRGRVVAEYLDRDSHIDRYTRKDQTVFATVEADLSDDTLLTGGISQQTTDTRGQLWGGLPVWYASGERTNWDRSKSTAANWSRGENTTTGYFLRLEQRLANDWQVTATASKSEREAQSYLLYLYGTPDRATGIGLAGGGGAYLVDRDQTDFGLQAGGPFTLFGRKHEASVGFVSQRQEFDAKTGGYIPVAVGDFNAWSGAVPEPAWSDFGPSDGAVTTQRAAYAATRLSIADPLHVILGARVTNYEKRATLTTARQEENGVVTPYAGVVFDVHPDVSLYASYTDIFQPQQQRDVTARTLDPVLGKSYEVGTKGELLDGRLTASFAVFQIKQDNLAKATGTKIPAFPQEDAYTESEGATSRGFEIDVNGALTPDWNLSAGYAQFRAKDAADQDVNPIYPRKTLRVHTTYRLPTLRGLTVGGGVNWQDTIYTTAANPQGQRERIEQGAYALVDLMARYDVTPDVSVQLNLNNVFDKGYYTMFDAFNQLTYGAPRNGTVRLTYRF